MARGKKNSTQKRLRVSPASKPTASSATKSVGLRSSAKMAAPTTGRLKKARRYRPGKKALKEIRAYQKSVNPLICKAPFERNVRDIARKINWEIRFQPTAIEALQVAAEQYLVELFHDANLCAAHSKRVTMRVDDLKIVRKLRDSHI